MLLHNLTEVECKRYRRDCNFTDSERAVFDLAVRGRSRVEIALSLAISTAPAAAVGPSTGRWPKSGSSG